MNRLQQQCWENFGDPPNTATLLARAVVDAAECAGYFNNLSTFEWQRTVLELLAAPPGSGLVVATSHDGHIQPFVICFLPAPGWTTP